MQRTRELGELLGPIDTGVPCREPENQRTVRTSILDTGVPENQRTRELLGLVS